MNRRTATLVTAVIVASFAGGAVSHWLLSPPVAQAQDDPKPKPVVTGKKIVSASAFILVNDQGVEQAKLALSKAGRPTLVMRRANGKPGIVISISPAGKPIVGMYDKTGAARASYGLAANGDPGLAMIDAKGKLRTICAVSAKGPAIVLMDSAGKTRVLLGQSETPAYAGIQIADGKGDLIWKAPPKTPDMPSK